MWGYPYSPDKELEDLKRYRRILELRYKMIETELRYLGEKIKILREYIKEFSSLGPSPQYMFSVPLPPSPYQQMPPYPQYPVQMPSFPSRETMELKGRHRIVVATQGPKGLDDIVSPVFGRAPFFTIIDVEDGEIKNIETVENRYGMMPGGAGIAVAQYMRDLEADIVIAGSFGQNSINILENMGIRTIVMPPTQLNSNLKNLGIKLEKK